MRPVLQSDAVRVYAVSVDVNRKRVDRPVSTVPDRVGNDVTGVLQHNSQVQSENSLPLWCGLWCIRGRGAGLCTDGCANLAGDVAAGVASPAVLAGDVAIGVASPAVAGVASLADLAGDVAVGVLHWPLPGRRPWPTSLMMSP